MRGKEHQTVEEQLLGWIAEKDKSGERMTAKDVKDAARRIHRQVHPKCPGKGCFIASPNWCYTFIRRNNLGGTCNIRRNVNLAVETELLRWIVGERSRGVPLGARTIRSRAYHMHQEIHVGCPGQMCFTASMPWYCRFRNKHKLELSMREPPNRRRNAKRPSEEANDDGPMDDIDSDCGTSVIKFHALSDGERSALSSVDAGGGNAVDKSDESQQLAVCGGTPGPSRDALSVDQKASPTPFESKMEVSRPC